VQRFRSIARVALVSGLIFGLGGNPVARAAEEMPAEPAARDLGLVVFDAALLRPLGAISTLAGAGFFVVSLPLVLPAGQFETAKEVLIDTPVEDTFARPLGSL